MSIATSRDASARTRACASPKVPQHRRDAQTSATIESASDQRVQRDTSNASALAAGNEKLAPRRAISRVALAELSDQQKRGYELVGKSPRVKTCGTIPVMFDQVALGITDKGGVQCSGLARCASRWCPDCWGKIAKQRADDVKQVVEWAHEQGYIIVLATLTAAHVENSTLKDAGGNQQQAVMRQNVGDVFDGLCAAWRYANGGRASSGLRAGQVGYARGFELTCDGLGAKVLTGTHGHFHVLFVLEKWVNLSRYKSLLWERWSAGCEKNDLDTSYAGFDFKRIKVGNKKHVQAAASYIVKGEKLDADRVGLEVARADQKNGRGKLRTTPEGLLRAVALLTPEAREKLGNRAVAQWRGIEEACQGRRWLTWSRDLRKNAGLGQEMTDEEAANAAEAVENDQVAVVQYSEVAEHLDALREVVREAKTSERWGMLLCYLDSFGIHYSVQTQSDWDEKLIRFLRERRELKR